MTVVAVISKTFLFFTEISASDSHNSHFPKRVRGGQNLYGLIESFLTAARRLCMDILRTDELSDLEIEPNARVAVLYATAYLYEHREEADHKALTLSLRALLSGSRKEAF